MTATMTGSQTERISAWLDEIASHIVRAMNLGEQASRERMATIAQSGLPWGGVTDADRLAFKQHWLQVIVSGEDERVGVDDALKLTTEAREICVRQLVHWGASAVQMLQLFSKVEAALQLGRESEA
jgi:hypothetical protein